MASPRHVLHSTWSGGRLGCQQGRLTHSRARWEGHRVDRTLRSRAPMVRRLTRAAACRAAQDVSSLPPSNTGMPWGSWVLVLSTLGVAAAACRSVQRAGPSPAAGEGALSCSSPITGADAVLVPGSLVLLGELHGTTEVPRFVVDLACQAASRGTVIDVGLELSLEEQQRIESFLASAGTTEDFQALLEGEFWRRPYQDGRSSRAMLDLLDGIRRLKRSGARIQVFLFDRAKPGPNRDADMAKSILEVVARKQADLVLVLTGNVHARTEKFVMGSTEFVPMGFVLVKAGARVTSLKSAHPP